MEEKQLVQTTSDILAALGTIVEDLKRCLFSRDRRKMKDIEKALTGATMSSLPLFEDLIKKDKKTEIEERTLLLLPSLQKLGIGTEDLVSAIRTTLESDVPFTDKATTEIGQVMALTKDLARDTNDILTTRNLHFRDYAVTSATNIINRIDESMLEHQQRLITGLCTPKASFLYLDIMQSLKRIARELATLCEKA